MVPVALSQQLTNRLNSGPCLDFSAHNTTPPRWFRSFAFDGNQSINPSINKSRPTVVFMVCSWLTIFALLDFRLELMIVFWFTGLLMQNLWLFFVVPRQYPFLGY